MNDILGKFHRVSLLGSLLVLPMGLFAQSETDQEDAFELSPFEVTTTSELGYGSRDTLAGTRLRTDLRDVANAIQIVNSQFLQDTGSTDSASLLVYTTNTEVGGLSGNFSGVGDGSAPNDQSARVQPQNNTRVRGLDSADNTRNFFLTSIPWDGYNVTRVDIQRGANAVLFGIGSPAGIINTDLIKAEFFDRGKVELRIDSNSSKRATFDVNRQLVEGEWALRVAGLYEETEFQQKPAFERDRRIFVASRWDPSFLQKEWMDTSFQMNAEFGDISANRPRILPPEDRITPWFGPEVNKALIDPRTVDGTNYLDYERLGFPSNYGLFSPTFRNPANADQVNPNYNPWINRFAPVFGPVAVFNNPGSAEQSGILQVQGVAFPVPGVPRTFPNPPPSLPFNPWYGITSYRDYANRAQLPGDEIGAIKNRSLTDSSVFDFYENLLDGPTKYERDRFHSQQYSIRQGFFDNLIGYEWVIDRQVHNRENSQTIADDGYAIAVDMQQFLYNSSTANQLSEPGVPNPNVGRPFVAARGQNGFRQEQTNNSQRLTGFINFDVAKVLKTENLLTRILGRHIITGVYSENDNTQKNYQWFHSVIADGYNDANTLNISDYSDGRTQVGTVSYLGGDMRNLTSAADATINRIHAPRVAGGGTTQLFDWTVADTSIGTNPVNLGRYVGYRDAQLSVINSLVGNNRELLYNPNGTNLQRVETHSRVLVFQSYLLDNLIVPTISWREDKQSSARSGSSAVVSSAAYQGLRSERAGLIFTDPDWRLPTSADDVPGRGEYDSVSDQNVSWGVVVHSPDLINRHLPFGLRASVFYNESSNFSPDASRVNIFGRSVLSPIGETTDYGFTLSAFEDRLMLKVNWYESEVQNANLADAISNNYIIGFGEFWGYQFGRQAQIATQTGEAFAGFRDNYALVEVEDPNNPEQMIQINELGDGVFLAYEPSPGQTRAEAFVAQNLAIDTLLANPAPQEFQDAWNFSYADWEASPRTGNPGAGGINGNLAVLSTNRSEGVEFEFSARVTENWNLTFNAALTDAVRDEIANEYAVWVEERFELYQGPAGDVRMWNGSWANAQSETVRAKFTREFYGNYLQQRQLQNSTITENRKWRFNLVTNYSFTESVLKGVNVGAAYRWQDSQVVSYPVIPDPVSGYRFDIENPNYGPTETNVDLWIGYQRPLTSKIDWRIQLNVRNAFQGNKLIPVSLQPDGSPGIYRIQEGSNWFLTNTFSF